MFTVDGLDSPSNVYHELVASLYIPDRFTYSNNSRYYMITSGCLADGLKNGYQLIFLSQLEEAIEWDVGTFLADRLAFIMPDGTIAYAFVGGDCNSQSNLCGYFEFFIFRMDIFVTWYIEKLFMTHTRSICME